MTYARPANARYNHVNQNNNSGSGNVTKRTRGPINKRACQRCRQGKIKCDGDAETGKSCSNCDPSHCKFDNSPRKNKQVESLKLRLNVVEEQLVAITSEVSEQLQTKDIEKEILCLLYESREHFNGFENLFNGLRDALKQSRCLRQTLPITFELLKRLQDVKNIPEIMKSLQRFVDCANSDISLLPAYPSDMFKKIEESYNMGQPYQPLPVDDSMIMSYNINNTNEVEIGHLNLHSGDDDGSESPGTFDFNGESSPTTPPQPSQEVHSESKCFNNPQNLTSTTTSSEFFYDSSYYYQNQYNVNVMDNNYPMNFCPPTTTSPTDEPMAPWNITSN